MTGTIQTRANSNTDPLLDGAPVEVMSFPANGRVTVMLESDYNGYERGDLITIDEDEFLEYTG